MAESRYSPIVPLGAFHDRGSFDCGIIALDDYLRKYASQNQKRGIVRNYVATVVGQLAVVGYYSLVYASIDRELLPGNLTKGLGKYDIPAMFLARLAVDQREQGQGLGQALLKDATRRTMQAAEIAGLKVLLVDAKDEKAMQFYVKNGFESLPDNPLQLFLTVPVS